MEDPGGQDGKPVGREPRQRRWHLHQPRNKKEGEKQPTCFLYTANSSSLGCGTSKGGTQLFGKIFFNYFFNEDPRDWIPNTNFFLSCLPKSTNNKLFFPTKAGRRQDHPAGG